MKSRQFYLFTTVLLGLAWLPGALFAQTPTPTPEPSPAATVENAVAELPPPESTPTPAPKAAEDLVHLGDLIDVDVVGSTEYDWRGRLNPEGFLDGIDYADAPVYAFCRSEEAIAAEVAKAYAKILREPRVVVRILDRSNRPPSVLYGAIKTPQRFQIKRPFYLNELIVISGGLTERASGEIEIFRQKSLNCRQAAGETSAAGDDRTEKSREKYVKTSQDNGSETINIRISDLLSGKKEANPQILSGDVVTVREADRIYVIGGVANPRQISARTQTTLSRAVAAAGGTIKNADPTKITVYRRATGETKIIAADLEKIKTGEAEDLILRPFDVVEVEQNGRDKRKFPPIFGAAETDEKKAQNLPLRIID